ncbi:unnamed protein product, partial [Polarella glacialis]
MAAGMALASRPSGAQLKVPGCRILAPRLHFPDVRPRPGWSCDRAWASAAVSAALAAGLCPSSSSSRRRCTGWASSPQEDLQEAEAIPSSSLSDTSDAGRHWGAGAEAKALSDTGALARSRALEWELQQVGLTFEEL